jgi:hypothetical protein
VVPATFASHKQIKRLSSACQYSLTHCFLAGSDKGHCRTSASPILSRRSVEVRKYVSNRWDHVEIDVLTDPNAEVCDGQIQAMLLWKKLATTENAQPSLRRRSR